MFDLEKLNDVKFWNYGAKPFASDLDADVEKILNLVLCLPASQIDSERRKLSTEQRTVLRCFSERYAAFSVRKGSTEMLSLSLDALFFQCGVNFDRETLVILVLPLDAADRLGLGISEIAESSIQRANPALAADFRRFVGRALEDKSLGCMGYEARNNGQNFSYVRNW